VLDLSLQQIADGSDLLPDASLSAARFSGNYCRRETSVIASPSRNRWDVWS